MVVVVIVVVFLRFRDVRDDRFRRQQQSRDDSGAGGADHEGGPDAVRGEHQRVGRTRRDLDPEKLNGVRAET